MQSIFRLPWCSEHISPKLADKPAPLEGMPTAPVVDICLPNKYKRKRSASPDAVSKKARGPEQANAALHHMGLALVQSATAPAGESAPHLARQTPPCDSIIASPTTSVDGRSGTQPRASSPSTSKRDLLRHSTACEIPSAELDNAPAMTRLQQVIENEFNLQILFKHNELRLIEQELAKCQVALEQLRRCEIRPYPGFNRPSDSVISGTGPSVYPPPGFTRPSHAAPFGAADGPYSRHYRQWLVSDPSFDPVSEQILAFMEAANVASRSTRNSGHTPKSSKSIAQPARSAEQLQSIPNYPAVPPRDKSAPLVLKRSTDNQLVKLICNNCHRGNFSSIQGFLNHCRIAHKVDLKSHDEAAIKCGQPLDESEMASLPTDAVSTPISKPAPARTSTAAPTPGRTFVHPLNTAAGVPLAASQKANPPARAPARTLMSADIPKDRSPFTPSLQAPRLSAQFAKYQLGGNLAQATAAAKQHVDLGIEEEVLAPDEMEATVSGELARPPSRKGVRQPAGSRPRPSPLQASSLNSGKKLADVALDSPQDQQSVQSSLSPHTTDANPGMVSDHDDDEDQASASEAEENSPRAADMRGPSLHVDVPRNCVDHEGDLDGEDSHEMDADGVVIRRNSLNSIDAQVSLQSSARARKYGGGK